MHVTHSFNVCIDEITATAKWGNLCPNCWPPPIPATHPTLMLGSMNCNTWPAVYGVLSPSFILT